MDDAVETFVEQYTAAVVAFKNSCKTPVLALLAQARIFADARRTLPAADYLTFRRKTIGLGKKSDARRASLLTLARAHDTLVAFVDDLPPSVTALSALAHLTADQLQAAKDAGTLRVEMTGLDAQLLAAENRPAKSKSKKKNKSKQPRRVAGDLSVTIRWDGTVFVPANADRFVSQLQKLVAKHAAMYGLVDSIIISPALGVALAENEAAAA